MEFYSVAANLETRKAVYYRCHNGLPGDMLWIRASASVPVLSRRVEINGKSYLDGGVSDPILVKFFERKGYKRNVVILTKPKGYKMRPADYMFWLKIRYQKYPNFIKAVTARHIVYNETINYINEKEKRGEIVVVRPSYPTEASLIEHNPDNLQKTYEDGIRQCKKSLKKIKDYINETKTM